jgi:hypothetical protein
LTPVVEHRWRWYWGQVEDAASKAVHFGMKLWSRRRKRDVPTSKVKASLLLVFSDEDRGMISMQLAPK